MVKKKFTIFFHTWELEGKVSAMCCVPLDHVLSIILGNDLIVDRDCRSFLPYSANSLMDPPYMAAFHPRASIQRLRDNFQFERLEKNVPFDASYS